MTGAKKARILGLAKTFFRDRIAINHRRNTEKLASLKEFNVNPFLHSYLARFLTGNTDPASMAKALVYPRALQTSITTSFGTNMQYFVSDVLGGLASLVAGMDIEYDDPDDRRHKFCQVKLGPNTINADDVDTIVQKFRRARNLARQNRRNVSREDFVVGVLYGSPEQLSGHYREIRDEYEYPVIVGKDFWYKLTGDKGFYSEIIRSIGEVAEEIDGVGLLNEVIRQLAIELQEEDPSE